jgi:hypothetical protein
MVVLSMDLLLTLLPSARVTANRWASRQPT